MAELKNAAKFDGTIPTTQQMIESVCEEIKQLLLEKNKCYGDSALNPVRIFSKSSALEQIAVRIDDKLSRLVRGSEFPGDDTLKDLIGYFVLLVIAERVDKIKKTQFDAGIVYAPYVPANSDHEHEIKEYSIDYDWYGKDE